MPIEIARSYFNNNPKSRIRYSVCVDHRRTRMGEPPIKCYLVVSYFDDKPINVYIYDDGPSAFELMHSLACDGKMFLYVPS